LVLLLERVLLEEWRGVLFPTTTTTQWKKDKWKKQEPFAIKDDLNVTPNLPTYLIPFSCTIHWKTLNPLWFSCERSSTELAMSPRWFHLGNQSCIVNPLTQLSHYLHNYLRKWVGR
jgi:hypothetical protein